MDKLDLIKEIYFKIHEIEAQITSHHESYLIGKIQGLEEAITIIENMEEKNG